MILYTVQRLDFWDECHRRGAIESHGCHWSIFLGAYDWMRGQMKARIGAPPFVDAWPIWAWEEAPDLRVKGLLGKGQEGLLVKFEAPEKTFLRSGFEAWHAVLNDEPFVDLDCEPTYDGRETCAHAAHVENCARDYLRRLIGQDAALKRASWNLIFDARGVQQATLWRVPLDWVVSHKRFKAR